MFCVHKHEGKGGNDPSSLAQTPLMIALFCSLTATQSSVRVLFPGLCGPVE